MYKFKGILTEQVENRLKIMARTMKYTLQEEFLVEIIKQDGFIRVNATPLQYGRGDMSMNLITSEFYRLHEDPHNHRWVEDQCLYCGKDRCLEYDSMGIQCALDLFHEETSFHASSCQLVHNAPLEFEVWDADPTNIKFTRSHGEECYCPRTGK